MTKSIILLVAVIHTCNETEMKPYFTVIPTNLINIFGIEGIWRGQQSMKDHVVTNMIKELDTSIIGWVQSESN